MAKATHEVSADEAVEPDLDSAPVGLIQADRVVEGVQIVDSGGVEAHVNGDSLLPPGTTPTPIVDDNVFRGVTAGEHRACGIFVDEKYADDQIPPFVQMDRYVTEGTVHVADHVVATPKAKATGPSAADRVASLDDKAVASTESKEKK